MIQSFKENRIYTKCQMAKRRRIQWFLTNYMNFDVLKLFHATYTVIRQSKQNYILLKELILTIE